MWPSPGAFWSTPGINWWCIPVITFDIHKWVWQCGNNAEWKHPDSRDGTWPLVWRVSRDWFALGCPNNVSNPCTLKSLPGTAPTATSRKARAPSSSMSGTPFLEHLGTHPPLQLGCSRGRKSHSYPVKLRAQAFKKRLRGKPCPCCAGTVQSSPPAGGLTCPICCAQQSVLWPTSCTLWWLRRF